ncbi:MAG TPA: hypothetical protein VFO85_13675, partial [Vicinamibacteria bacterium]|nr:hypothetical protein [Vicinamibacteria bacterium]
QGAPGRTLAAVTVTVLAAGLLLERWPGPRTSARFGDALDLGGGTTAFVSGAGDVEDGALVARAGHVRLLVRSRAPAPALRLLAEGEGVLRVAGRPPLLLRGRAVEMDLPLQQLRRLTGRRGVEETLLRQTIAVESARPVLMRLRVP